MKHYYFDSHLMRIRRRALKLSQAQLADMIGVTKNSISLFENGFMCPRFNTVCQLSVVLDVPIQDFVLVSNY